MRIAPAVLAILLSIPVQSQVRTPSATASKPHSSIVYINREYGFRFTLPRSWKGYSVTVKRTEGDFRNVMPAYITIRNPHWTQQEPYEDIPIMVFAAEQWPKVADETVSVSAAPFPPHELGRNKRYVFALPARYNYDFSMGYEEVDKIMGSKPLRGFD